MSRPTRVPFPLPHVASKVFCGADASAVITDAGRLFCCGSNRGNKLGLDDAAPDVVVVEEATTLTPAPGSSALANAVVTFMDIGTAHSAVIADGGDLYLLGSNQFGQLSCLVKDTPTSSSSSSSSSSAAPPAPHRKQQLRRFPPTLVMRKCCTLVSCGDTFTIAATTDGRVMSWGKSARGRLGREVKGDSTEAKAIHFGAGEPKFRPWSLVSSHGTTLLAVKPVDDV